MKFIPEPITDILEIAADNNTGRDGADKLAVFNVLEDGKRDGNLNKGSNAQYLLGRVIVPYDIMR